MAKVKLFTILSFLIFGSVSIFFLSESQISKNFKEAYGMVSCPDTSMLQIFHKASNGIRKSTINNKTHTADANAFWGKKTWINDLYFGLNGGLFIGDEIQHQIFKNELKKVAQFILEDSSKYPILPYAVDATGESCDRNLNAGMDYDRCAEFVLMVLKVYEFTGDKFFLQQMYPFCNRIINWLSKQNRDSDILIEGRSLKFPVKNAGSCASSTYIGDTGKNDFKDFGANLLYFEAVDAIALIESILDREEQMKLHMKLGDSIRKEINRIMWNELSKGYYGWIDSNYIAHDDWITGNNLQAVACGLANTEQSRRIFERLNENMSSLRDVVPLRARIDTFKAGFSSNAANYYWNGGCWPLLVAPALLAYRKMDEINEGYKILDILSKNAVTTQYGFYESYRGDNGTPNKVQGLLMNNGGVLWGLFEGVLGLTTHGDTLLLNEKVPKRILPVSVRVRYRGQDLYINWKPSSQSSATINGITIIPKNGTYNLFHFTSQSNENKIINIGVTN